MIKPLKIIASNDGWYNINNCYRNVKFSKKQEEFLDNQILKHAQLESKIENIITGKINYMYNSCCTRPTNLDDTLKLWNLSKNRTQFIDKTNIILNHNNELEKFLIKEREGFKIVEKLNKIGELNNINDVLENNINKLYYCIQNSYGVTKDINNCWKYFDFISSEYKNSIEFIKISSKVMLEFKGITI